MLYQINKGSKSFGPNVIFEDIQFEVKNVEKIAVIGRNGCGKTTFLKTITNEEDLDSGTVHKVTGLKIGYLSQQTFKEDNNTVEEELNKAFVKIFELQKKLDKLTIQLSEDYSEKVLEDFANVQQEFEMLNGYNYKQEMMTVFTKFGFTQEDLKREIHTFSGGQKTKLAFVKLLLSKPDILLLDEPTNHLDLMTVEWLEGYLKYYTKAIILVSHDRMFLDKIVDVVYEIELGKMTKYSGNYTSFVQQKKLSLEKQAAAYANQQKDIARLETLIEKFRYKKNKAAFAQSKIKYLDRMDRIQLDNTDTKTFKAKFKLAKKSGKQVLTLKDYKVGYDTTLCTIDLDVLQGEKIAIIGPNGKGKSTFVKSIMDVVENRGGDLLWGHQVEKAYFDQQLAQFTTTKTVLEELWDEYPTLEHKTIRTTLGTFLFSADDVFKTVDVLSGGEKVRLSLAKILLKQANLLILDEPTNHLDILGKEALEESLSEYEGTVLFVSHDRYFIQKLATSILVIDNGTAQYHKLNYQEYLDKNAIIDAEQTQQKKSIDSRSESKIIKRSKKEVEKIEKEIALKEKMIEDLKGKAFEKEYYDDYKKMSELDAQIEMIGVEIMSLMEKWEKYHE